ncbi:MAG: hypothetical protein WD045_00775 [Pirellulaceae bacterium]
MSRHGTKITGKYWLRATFAALLVLLPLQTGAPLWGDTNQDRQSDNEIQSWQERAVTYARLMSEVKWKPVADGMPKRGGFFEKGVEYQGVPYSSVKSVGRDIGFDISLNTFLAAVENPKSVLYTENLKGKISNAECYYGKVCSTYTSYALQCAFPYVSRHHGPEFRDGVSPVEPQLAQAAQAGDIIYTPPKSVGAGSHIAIVTEVTRDDDGRVTHVRVEESSPQTTKNTNRSAKQFDSHLASRNNQLYRITDLEDWHAGNAAEGFRFPNFNEDSTRREINRVLLLDLGDWVPYDKGQPVKFNVMDKDSQGVKSLVIQRGDTVIEEIAQPEKGVLERSFATCGDYTAYCIMADGSRSQACEFSICELDFQVPSEKIALGESIELKFSAENIKVAAVHVWNDDHMRGRSYVYLTDEDRSNERVAIPAEAFQFEGETQVWLIGESKHGRLKKRHDILVVE